MTDDRRIELTEMLNQHKVKPEELETIMREMRVNQRRDRNVWQAIVPEKPS